MNLIYKLALAPEQPVKEPQHFYLMRWIGNRWVRWAPHIYRTKQDALFALRDYQYWYDRTVAAPK